MNKRPKVETPSALEMLVPARATRERMEDHGGFAPMVVFAPRHARPVMAIVDHDGPLHEGLAELLAQMRAKLVPAEWVALTSDVYTKPAAAVGDAVPGTLAKQFADGDPLVTEQMMVVLARRGGPIEAVAQCYRYSIVDGFEWDPPETMEDYVGAIPDVIRHYM